MCIRDSSMHLLFIAKNLERAGDHATNIAEQVIFLVDGRDIEIPSVPLRRLHRERMVSYVR